MNINDYNAPQASQTQQPRITINQTSEVRCTKCNNNTFHEAMFMRSVSPIVTGAKKPTFIPVSTFACDFCNFVNEEFIPNELKSKITRLNNCYK